MKLRKTNNNTHGLLSNFKFMINEQWNFEKKGVIIPFIRIPTQVAVSLMSLWIIKVVLDAIEKTVTYQEFIINIGLLTMLLMLLMYVSYYSEQSLYMNCVKIWNLRFYINKVWKIVDMDYPKFASTEGKTKILNGHIACSRNINVNMTSFYPHLIELIINIFGLVIFSAALVTLSPIIIIVLVLSYVINAFIVLYVEKWEHKTKDERAKINRKFEYVVHETSNNRLAKDIRAYNMITWINKKANQVLQDKLNWEKKIEAKRFLQLSTATIISFVQNGLAYAFLIWKVLNNEITIGEFAFYFGVISGFAHWLEQIVARVGKLSHANHLVDDYRNLMEIEDEFNREKGALLPSLTEPVEISLVNVSFKYNNSDNLILDNLNLTIKKGERLAIVGPNGAGKTTLVKLLCGLLKPTSGRILINGIEISEFNRDDYYTLITAVFQNVCLLPISIARNITFCSDSDIDWDKLHSSVEKAGIKEKIESLPNGYNTNLVPSVAGSGVELSGGENQKLLLARALYKNAPLLILDEPTAALDPIAENDLYLKFDEMTNNKTSIYISHRLSSTRFCDKIIYLNNHRIIETGTHSELLELGGEYKKNYDIQSQYYKNVEDKKG